MWKLLNFIANIPLIRKELTGTDAVMVWHRNICSKIHLNFLFQSNE